MAVGFEGVTKRYGRQAPALDNVTWSLQRGARASDVELKCAETGYSRFPVVGADGEAPPAGAPVRTTAG